MEETNIVATFHHETAARRAAMVLRAQDPPLSIVCESIAPRAPAGLRRWAAGGAFVAGGIAAAVIMGATIFAIIGLVLGLVAFYYLAHGATRTTGRVPVGGLLHVRVSKHHGPAIRALLWRAGAVRVLG